MARLRIPAVGGFSDPDINNFNTDIPINFHPVNYASATGEIVAMVSSPGTETVGDLHLNASSDTVRGQHRMNGRNFVVVGNQLWEVDDDSNVVGAVIGAIAGTTSSVRMFHKFVSDGTNSNYELGIIAEGNLYSYIDGATTELQNVSATNYNAGTIITNAGPTNIGDGTVLNNRALITKTNSSTFYVGMDVFVNNAESTNSSLGGSLLSALRVGTTTVSNARGTIGWRSAALTAREDTCAGIMRNNLTFYLFGRRVIETWTNAGVAGNPFRRINGQVYDLGAAATATIQQATTPQGEDVTVFLAQDSYGALSVIKLGMGGAQPISNKEIEAFLGRNVTDASDANGFFYRQNNDLYYQINFTTDNFTFVYDFERNAWHKRQDINGNRHKANTALHYNNMTVIGGYDDKRLYNFSDNILTDDYNGTIEPIHKRYQLGLVQDDNFRKVYVYRVEADFIQGQGKGDEDVSIPYDRDADPIVYLSYSKDRGNTWSNSIPATIGEAGMLRTVTRWRRFGSSKEGYVFRIESWSDRAIIMLGIAIDTSIGTE